MTPRRHPPALFSATIAVALLAGALIAFAQWRAAPAHSGAAGGATVSTGDYWFCGPPFQNGVCDTHIEPGQTVVWDLSDAEIEHSIVDCGASCDAPTDQPA